jgi:hypothetical protein
MARSPARLDVVMLTPHRVLVACSPLAARSSRPRCSSRARLSLTVLSLVTACSPLAACRALVMLSPLAARSPHARSSPRTRRALAARSPARSSQDVVAVSCGARGARLHRARQGRGSGLRRGATGLRRLGCR